MNRIFLTAALFAAAVAPGSAQPAADAPVAPASRAGLLGLGVLLGDPTAGSAKYWIDDMQAIVAGIGVSQSLLLYSDYVFHGWDLIPQPKRGRLAAYAAVGGRLEFMDQTDFGIRALPGLSYWPNFKRPVEFFIDVGPVFRLTNGLRVRVDGGFGLRVHFTPR